MIRVTGTAESNGEELLSKAMAEQEQAGSSRGEAEDLSRGSSGCVLSQRAPEKISRAIRGSGTMLPAATVPRTVGRSDFCGLLSTRCRVRDSGRGAPGKRPHWRRGRDGFRHGSVELNHRQHPFERRAVVVWQFAIRNAAEVPVFTACRKRLAGLPSRTNLPAASPTRSNTRLSRKLSPRWKRAETEEYHGPRPVACRGGATIGGDEHRFVEQVVGRLPLNTVSVPGMLAAHRSRTGSARHSLAAGYR